MSLQVGKSLGASILDLTGQNPCTRLPNSEFHSLSGLVDWLRMACVKNLDEPAKLKTRRSQVGQQNENFIKQGTDCDVYY